MAYKFQLGAAKLAGAIDVVGEVKGTSLDATDGNITDVADIALDSISADGGSLITLSDTMQAATNKQLQFRAPEQRIFSPSANQMAIEASASIQFDIGTAALLRLDGAEVTVMNKPLFLSGAAGKLRYGANMNAGRLLVSDGTDFESVAMSGDASLASNGAVTIANNAVSLAKMAGITRGSIIIGNASGDPAELAKGTAAQFLQSDGTDVSYVSMSGDVVIAAGGAATIQANAVEGSMINSNAAGNGMEYASNSLRVKASGSASGLAVDAGGVKVNLSSSNGLVLDAGGLDLAATIAGNRTFTGNVTFQGAVLSASVSNLLVEDAEIVIADGAGALAAGQGLYLGEDSAGTPLASFKVGTAVSGQDAFESSLRLKASNFHGALVGNADSATVGSTVTLADESADQTCFVAFSNAATGNQALKTGTNLTFDAASGSLAATKFIGDGSSLTGVTATGLTRLIQTANGASNVVVDNAMMGKILAFTADVSNGGSGRSVTLPAHSAGNVGKSILIKATNAAAEPITIARNANSDLIDGATADITLQSDSAAVELIYLGNGGGAPTWIIV